MLPDSPAAAQQQQQQQWAPGEPSGLLASVLVVYPASVLEAVGISRSAIHSGTGDRTAAVVLSDPSPPDDSYSAGGSQAEKTPRRRGGLGIRKTLALWDSQLQHQHLRQNCQRRLHRRDSRNQLQHQRLRQQGQHICIGESFKISCSTSVHANRASNSWQQHQQQQHQQQPKISYSTSVYWLRVLC